MPILKHKLPSYCQHKGTGQAVVRIDLHNQDRLAASAQGTVTIMDARK